MRNRESRQPRANELQIVKQVWVSEGPATTRSDHRNGYFLHQGQGGNM
jgi:hypothetical protein